MAVPRRIANKRAQRTSSKVEKSRARTVLAGDVFALASAAMYCLGAFFTWYTGAPQIRVLGLPFWPLHFFFDMAARLVSADLRDYAGAAVALCFMAPLVSLNRMVFSKSELGPAG